MTSFGSLIRSYRLRAGLGLRTFAMLIDQRASIVSAVESNRRAPWRQAATLHRVAEVLGVAETSKLWLKIVELAYSNFESPAPSVENAPSPASADARSLAWWWCAEETPALDDTTLTALATFVGAAVDFDGTAGHLPAANSPNHAEPTLPVLTELAIEWRVRSLLGRREAHLATAPVDVEAALENEAGVRLEIVPGLIPRFSVQACAVQAPNGLTFFIDRIVADSRPMAAYRHLVALCFAPSALWQSESAAVSPAISPHGWRAARYRRLQDSQTWPHRLRDCERFALAMLLPANPVLAAAESAYRELVHQQGWIDVEEAARALRNRLAEQFAVPPAVVHRRLVGWPCHLYGRIAQALSAQEPTLPPLDWLVEKAAPRQRTLFDLGPAANCGQQQGQSPRNHIRLAN